MMVQISLMRTAIASREGLEQVHSVGVVKSFVVPRNSLTGDRTDVTTQPYNSKTDEDEKILRQCLFSATNLKDQNIRSDCINYGQQEQ